MFDDLAIRDARPIAWMKRFFIAAVVSLLVIGALATHRAYFQVRSLDLKAPQVLTTDSVVEAAVAGSGRNRVNVEIELIQGEHAEVLFTIRVPGNNLAFFDPRAQHATQSVVLDNERLLRFQTGAARLRATATGRPQWGRTPPPTVREIDVQIRQ
ncbi:MAG TPA: hypothetical protein VJT15_11085 [Pyrinomonadaceae bacterium]|nr:hypothetical protein [Pyrinomonadaceae bacterium]